MTQFVLHSNIYAFVGVPDILVEVPDALVGLIDRHFGLIGTLVGPIVAFLSLSKL